MPPPTLGTKRKMSGDFGSAALCTMWALGCTVVATVLALAAACRAQPQPELVHAAWISWWLAQVSALFVACVDCLYGEWEALSSVSLTAPHREGGWPQLVDDSECAVYKYGARLRHKDTAPAESCQTFDDPC